jgi:hypothetical protein
MRNVSKKAKMNLPYGPYQYIKELYVTRDIRFNLHLLREASDGTNFISGQQKPREKKRINLSTVPILTLTIVQIVRKELQ